MPPAAAPAGGALRDWLRPDLLLPVGLIASVLVLLAPLPTPVMDLLLAANIAVSVLMLLTTVYVRTPVEFSVFPTLLLATTLGRLVLNVASTRLILTRAETDGLSAAGEVIRTFGEFVTGDRVVVGLIVFAIIVIIQFVVITKGATRISEVAARFALDGMPGKQMAIDADLQAGVIGEAEAQRRRAEVAQQADFYGAMDGASKFVRGDAIAGILITCINIVGGLFIGVVEMGMPVEQAGLVFTKLTIGDGLVAQVPAFLISLAAGVLTTRSTSRTNLPGEFSAQLSSQPMAIAITGVCLALLALTGLPALPLLAMAGGCGALTYVLSQRPAPAPNSQATTSQGKSAGKPADAPQAAKAAEPKLEDFLAVDPLEVEIGVSLIRLADAKRGGDLLARIQRVRHTVAADIGIVLPKVRIRDNLTLGSQEYRIKLAGQPVAEGIVHPQRWLAVDEGQATGKIDGAPAVDPIHGRPAWWVELHARERAEAAGYRLIDPASVLVAHLSEVIRCQADELLTRDATQQLLDQLRATAPAAVEELIPGQMRLAEVHRILQRLLRERVSIRNLATILEALGDLAPHTHDAEELTEHVRQRLARTISLAYRDEQKRLTALTLAPALEAQLAGNEELAGALNDLVGEALGNWPAGKPPVLVVSPAIRAQVRTATCGRWPSLAVLSRKEITSDTKLEVAGTLKLEAAPVA